MEKMEKRMQKVYLQQLEQKDQVIKVLQAQMTSGQGQTRSLQQPKPTLGNYINKAVNQELTFGFSNLPRITQSNQKMEIEKETMIKKLNFSDKVKKPEAKPQAHQLIRTKNTNHQTN
ncbi:MAG: hypothetical protein QF536_10050 [Arenicellales bacterium]|jgi:hypothetical protein|nr:hypothetical protein [Arenicellales bacterium]